MKKFEKIGKSPTFPAIRPGRLLRRPIWPELPVQPLEEAMKM